MKLAKIIFALLLLVFVPTSFVLGKEHLPNDDYQSGDMADYMQGSLWAYIVELNINNESSDTIRSMRNQIQQSYDDKIRNAQNNNYTGYVEELELIRNMLVRVLDVKIKQVEAAEAATKKSNNQGIIHQVIMDGANSIDLEDPPQPNPVISNFSDHIHRSQVQKTTDHLINGHVASSVQGGVAIVQSTAPQVQNPIAGLPPDSVTSESEPNEDPTPTKTPTIIVQPGDGTDSSQSTNSEDSNLPTNIHKPLRFTNSGVDPVTVRPETFVSNPEVAPASQSIASTVVFPGSNPSAYLSLPQGTYTFCYDWELDGDEDGDGYIDYAHKSTSQVSLVQNSPDEVEFATTVNLNPEANSNPNGKCNRLSSQTSGELTPQELANQGTFTYSSICNWSDGDQTSEQQTIHWEFFESAVIGTADGEPETFSKNSANIYEQLQEDVYSKITFTDTGFDLYAEGYGYTINCTVTK